MRAILPAVVSPAAVGRYAASAQFAATAPTAVKRNKSTDSTTKVPIQHMDQKYVFNIFEAEDINFWTAKAQSNLVIRYFCNLKAFLEKQKLSQSTICANWTWSGRPPASQTSPGWRSSPSWFRIVLHQPLVDPGEEQLASAAQLPGEKLPAAPPARPALNCVQTV